MPCTAITILVHILMPGVAFESKVQKIRVNCVNLETKI